MQPAGNTTTTTTTTEIWQWQCAVCRADWKMLRQVTTRCPHGHGCRCCQGSIPPPSAGNPPLPHHHHHHHHHHRRHHHLPQQEGSSWALAADADEGSKSKNAGRNTTTLSPAPPAVAQVCWVPDPHLMVQQLREFEHLNDEVVALRVQLQEYAAEIERSISRRDDDAGTDWFLTLPTSVRDVLVMAKDTIESFIAMSTTAPAN
ncbi:hypothetical protein SETIT_4G113700v2 [Setaria italica]|uniref:Uncharacterized protein n=1 Tax=Setaria italica TaxID=4555 RepID=A0A368QTN9_SETIT|nr:protein hunchback [Setaria italica]RCV21138.1 hypothetical protein SETIT_4G113700v2 [Setaria italica]